MTVVECNRAMQDGCSSDVVPMVGDGTRYQRVDEIKRSYVLEKST